MNRLSPIFSFIFLCCICSAQNNYFSFVAGAGPGFFIGDHTHHPLNRSWLVGCNYLLSNKKQAIAFNPGIHIQSNNYNARIENYRFAVIKEHALNIHLDMLLKLSRKIYLRTGLLFNAVYRNSVDIVDEQRYGHSYYSFSNDSIYGPYAGTSFQAGITVGICFLFKMFKREQRFGIQLNQMATPLVSRDYRLSKNIVGRDVTLLSASSKPTMLLLTLELNMKKKLKKKNEEEE